MHDSGWWDIAQVCVNGHLVNQRVIEEHDHSQPLCVRCGSPTIMACRLCRAPIRGHRVARDSRAGGQRSGAPCHVACMTIT
jgi:hypothetical protein